MIRKNPVYKYLVLGLLLVAFLVSGRTSEKQVFAEAGDTKDLPKSVMGSLGSLVGELAGGLTDSPEVLTIYISGIDTRSDEMVDKSLSDVNILVTLNTRTKEILLVSTPRDYFVPLSISNGAPDKLTHAGNYGIDVCVDTMEMLYDIDIDYYLRFNFHSLTEIVGILGDITVHSDFAFDSGKANGFHFNEGDNILNAEQALAFVRERYAFEEGDRQRGKNQMYVIEGIMKKLESMNLQDNLSELLECVTKACQTNMPYTMQLKFFTEELPHLMEYHVDNYSVTGRDGKEIPYSMSEYAYVMYPDQDSVDEAKARMEEVREG